MRPTKQLTQTMPHTYVAVGKATMQLHRLYSVHNPIMHKPRAICLLILQLKFHHHHSSMDVSPILEVISKYSM